MLAKCSAMPAGINTAIYSPSGASAGVGFAVPIDVLRSSVNQIIKHGRVIRPILGIAFAPEQSVEQVHYCCDGCLTSYLLIYFQIALEPCQQSHRSLASRALLKTVCSNCNSCRNVVILMHAFVP